MTNQDRLFAQNWVEQYRCYFVTHPCNSFANESLCNFVTRHQRSSIWRGIIFDRTREGYDLWYQRHTEFRGGFSPIM